MIAMLPNFKTDMRKIRLQLSQISSPLTPVFTSVGKFMKKIFPQISASDQNTGFFSFVLGIFIIFMGSNVSKKTYKHKQEHRLELIESIGHCVEAIGTVVKSDMYPSGYLYMIGPVTIYDPILCKKLENGSVSNGSLIYSDHFWYSSQEIGYNQSLAGQSIRFSAIIGSYKNSDQLWDLKPLVNNKPVEAFNYDRPPSISTAIWGIITKKTNQLIQSWNTLTYPRIFEFVAADYADLFIRTKKELGAAEIGFRVGDQL